MAKRAGRARRAEPATGAAARRGPPAAALAPWRIELLGGLRAERSGVVVSRFRTERTAALLGCLALAAGRDQTREGLIERCWPELDGSAGRAALSQALWALRKQLEPGGALRDTGGRTGRAGRAEVAPASPRRVIVATRGAVRLEAGAATTDVADLRAALELASRAPPSSADRRAALERAVGLYQGELLPGHFHDWVLAERERLRGAFLAAAHELVVERLRTSDLPRALDLARRAVAADPLSEVARRDLLRVLAAQGDAAAAEREYRLFERRLEQDLDARPSAETRALAAEIARRAGAGAASASALAEPGSGPGPGPGSGPSPRRTAAAPTAAPAPPVALPATSPPAPAPPAWGRLPLELGRLIGRERELARGAGAIAEGARLVTLTGPGGIGKTRLATALAEGLASSFGGAVAFVPLAELAEPALVPGAIVEALRLPPASGAASALERAAAALADRGRALLVLDNLEQLLPAGAGVVRALLERVRGLFVLATSRRPLGLDGERELPVAPLETPEGTPPLERLAALASTRLFLERARAARPDFDLTAANAEALAELLRRLDGIPLALALVAGRAQVQTPQQMLASLASLIDLRSRRHDVPARHRTLRATIAWSVALLEPDERRLFARLGVFRSAFSATAAARVLGLEPRVAEDLLAALRDCSLLATEERLGEVRFRMLETIRQLARAELAPEDLDALAERHAEHFAALADAGDAALDPPEQTGWVERLEAEQEDFRAALEWCRGSPRREVAAPLGLRLATALARPWERRGQAREGRRHLAAALAELPARTAARARGLTGLGLLASQLGDAATARAACEEGVAIARETGDRPALAKALQLLAHLARRSGELDLAERSARESLALYCELGGAYNRAGLINDLGLIAVQQGDLAAAEAAFTECIDIYRACGDVPRTALVNLAQIAEGRGDLPRALRLAEEAAAGFASAGDPVRLAIARRLIGTVRLELGEATAAARIHAENAELLRPLGARPHLAAELRALGRARIALGDLVAARLALEESERLLEGSAPGQAQALARTLASRGELESAAGAHGAALERYAAALALVRQTEPRSLMTARLLEGIADAAIAATEHERPLPRDLHADAARLLGAADGLRAALGTPRSRGDAERFERALGRLRRALGADAAAAALTSAQGLEPEPGADAAIALALGLALPSAGRPERPNERTR